MPTTPQLFTAISNSTREILHLLRCISFAKRAFVQISSEGLRFTTEEGSVMEAFVFLEKALFTSFTYNPTATASSQDGPPLVPLFEINLVALLETLNIFALSDTSVSRRPGGGYDAFAVHRLNRHAGTDPFANSTLGIKGTCTLSYDGEGSPFNIHMSEAGVVTTCQLNTYEAASIEELPFNRDRLALKTIMRSAALLDATLELSNFNPTELTISTNPSSRTGANFSLTAQGSLGSATIDFAANAASETPVLETFTCDTEETTTFKFSLLTAAQRAMAAATKVSLRLDEEGVLSLQFLVEVDAGGAGEGVAFVDFRILPVAEEYALQRGGGHDGDESDGFDD
ncbi:hypothetical protein MRB53_042072 [Persea americana]|nr:hypothetical protein MRB53_042072 [Persea americana]